MASTALTRSKAFYDVVPVDRRYAKSHSHSPFDVVRKFGQGAGAAYLVMSGSDAMSTSAAAGAPMPVMDLTSLNGLAESLATGGLNGPLQLAGALLIFLAAGRCMARFVGLLVVAVIGLLMYQGISLADIMAAGGDFVDRASAAMSAFQAPTTTA